VNKFLLCTAVVLISSITTLFAPPVLAASPSWFYREGDVVVVVHAPPFCGDVNVFSQALRDQAESFAENSNLSCSKIITSDRDM